MTPRFVLCASLCLGLLLNACFGGGPTADDNVSTTGDNTSSGVGTVDATANDNVGMTGNNDSSGGRASVDTAGTTREATSEAAVRPTNRKTETMGARPATKGSADMNAPPARASSSTILPVSRKSSSWLAAPRQQETQQAVSERAAVVVGPPSI